MSRLNADPDPNSHPDLHNILSTSHSDTDTTDTPIDGDVLTWDDTAGEWIAAPPAGGYDGGGSGGYEDLALWKVYTLDKTPSGSYPDYNVAKNGSGEKGLLTSEGFAAGPDAGFQVGYIGGRRATELTADGIWTIRVDLSSAMEITIGRVVGMWDTSQAISHPSEASLEYSDDDSGWTNFGTALTGMGSNPGTLNTGFWKCEFSAASASHRYWRFKVKAGNTGGEDWLFIGRVHLLGVR